MKSNYNKCRCGKDAIKKITIESDQGFFYCCESFRCKNLIESEIYDTRYRNKYFQGKSLKNYKFFVCP